ncbi:MAG: FAD-dependent monooxygenase [Nannocystis sp.]|nr:FAD-dependent monooxygenase [Nannocystis sp.]
MLTGRSDVLIVGAGPAGAAAGTFLARMGLSVTCVDRARFPRDKTCGDAVSSAGLEIAAAMGAALSQLPHATVRAAAAILPDGERIVRHYGAHPGAIVPRLALDDLLRQRMQAAGVTLHEGVAVRTLLRDGDHFVGAEGPALRWQARVVLAADGPGSVAWAALGREYPRGAQLGVAATVYLRNAQPQEPGVSEHYFERDLPCGYGWLFPPVEGLANVGVYQRADRYQRRGGQLRALLRDFLARHPDRFAAAEPVGPVRSWALPLCLHTWPPGGRPGPAAVRRRRQLRRSAERRGHLAGPAHRPARRRIRRRRAARRPTRRCGGGPQIPPRLRPRGQLALAGARRHPGGHARAHRPPPGPATAGAQAAAMGLRRRPQRAQPRGVRQRGFRSRHAHPNLCQQLQLPRRLQARAPAPTAARRQQRLGQEQPVGGARGPARPDRPRCGRDGRVPDAYAHEVATLGDGAALRD